VSGVVVRRLRPSEVDELRRVRLAMLADAPDAFHSRLEDEAAEPRQFWEDRARRAAIDEEVATFVAVEGDRHLGSATGLRLGPDEPALLVAMWVEPAARRRGLGRELVEAVCAWAERGGAKTVELDVREHNRAAIDLYRRAGFEVAAGPHPAAAAPDLMELRMARPLDRPQDGPVIARLRRALAGEDPLAVIEAAPAGDQRSLMLRMARSQSRKRTPAHLLSDRLRGDVYQPARVDARLLHEVEGAALAAADAFEPVTLPPVAPAGTNAVLAGLDQNLSVASVRGGEVLADPTSSLALEIALRRRAGEIEPALAATARVLRMQQPPPGWHRHFGLFTLASGGRAMPGDGFAAAALRAQLAVYLDMLDRLTAGGHAVGQITVELSDTAGLAASCRAVGVDVLDLAAEWRATDVEPEAILATAGVALPRFCASAPQGWERLERMAEQVLAPLAERFPRARLGFRPGRLHAVGYYRGLSLNIDAELGGEVYSVADGGTVDWTQQLLSDRRERLLVSGIGTERIARLLAESK
jgi:ribosomal protein S18 acetylase RimI-like enzyme